MLNHLQTRDSLVPLHPRVVLFNPAEPQLGLQLFPTWSCWRKGGGRVGWGENGQGGRDDTGIWVDTGESLYVSRLTVHMTKCRDSPRGRRRRRRTIRWSRCRLGWAVGRFSPLRQAVWGPLGGWKGAARALRAIHRGHSRYRVPDVSDACGPMESDIPIALSPCAERPEPSPCVAPTAWLSAFSSR